MLEWLVPLLVIIGSFLVLLFLGMPVAFAFALINILGVYLLWGGEIGLQQLILSIYASVTKFTMLPIIMFVLMGEVMFLSGMAPRMIDALGKLLGRLPGRLSLLTVMGATMFSTMSGSSMGTTALLGEVLVPEMAKRGYKKPMTIGPIIGSGGLAMMIPPTNLGIILATLAEVSVGKLLIAIVVPGFLLASLYFTYVITRCYLQAHLAPAYDVARTPLLQKLSLNLRYVLPLGLITFAVLGLIFLGVATPSQSAAMGTVASIILAVIYKGMNWQVFRKAVAGTTRIAGMVFMIITGATAFSQILASSGASHGMVNAVLGQPLSPILIVIAMQILVIILGCFMDPISIMMITIPIFMPIIHSLGFNEIWFIVVMLLSIEMAGTTPPFGMLLFVMKGVAPPDTTMGDIYKAGLPFLGCDLVLMAFMISFPLIVLGLPGLMH